MLSFDDRGNNDVDRSVTRPYLESGNLCSLEESAKFYQIWPTNLLKHLKKQKLCSLRVIYSKGSDKRGNTLPCGF